VLGDNSGSGSTSFSVNFGQRAFAYQNVGVDRPSADFKPLCTAFLPDPDIADGSTAFEVITYQGNNSTQTLPNLTTSPQELKFSPDFIWTKSRSHSYSHNVYDIVRGVSKKLFADDPLGESTDVNSIKAFNSDGFQVGNNDNGNYINGGTAVAWTWDAGGEPTADNVAGAGNVPTAGSVKINGSDSTTALAGSIPATRLSANTAAGFSIVTYTSSSSSNQTVGHGLNGAPHLVIVKNRDDGGDPWAVYTKVTGKDKYLYLNTTALADTLSEYWGSAEPTSDVFGVGAGLSNNRGTDDMVAYCFAPIEGYSAFGSYTGNGSTTGDGPFVYTGFRPRWLLIKDYTIGGAGRNWVIHDTERDAFNLSDAKLYANLNLDEVDGGNNQLDILSNGFKLKTGDTATNNSSTSYVWAAFAENPFKYSRAR